MTRAAATARERPRSIPTGPCPETWSRRRGTVPPRWRSVDCDLFRQEPFGPQLVDRVVGVDDAHRARGGPEHHRLRVRVHVLVTNALEQLSGRDARGGEENVVARAQVVEAEDLVGLVPLAHRPRALLLVAEEELRLHVTADRLDRARRQHAFGGAARTHHAVDPGPGLESRLE